jgi:post-segregation antitoxin (ccd killing protein)
MNISVPDELAEQVRTLKIPISETCQRALRKAVEDAQTADALLSDIEAVAARLRGTIADEDREQHEEGRQDGIKWAKKYATARELEDMASYDGRGGDFQDDHSLVAFMTDKNRANVVSVKLDVEEPYGAGFVAGAGEVWNAVADRI